MKKLISAIALLLLTVVCLSGCAGSYRLPLQSELPANTDPSTDGTSAPIYIDCEAYNTVSELLAATTNVFTGKVTDISVDIVDLQTGESDLSYSEEEAVNRNRDLYTVYTIEVSRSYQGECGAVEKIYIDGGCGEYNEAAQRELLKKTGVITQTFGCIPYLVSAPKLTVGESYLFCVHRSSAGTHSYLVSPMQGVYYQNSKPANAIKTACTFR